jgi:hypothetical protein
MAANAALDAIRAPTQVTQYPTGVQVLCGCLGGQSSGTGALSRRQSRYAAVEAAEEPLQHPALEWMQQIDALEAGRFYTCAKILVECGCDKDDRCAVQPISHTMLSCGGVCAGAGGMRHALMLRGMRWRWGNTACVLAAGSAVALGECGTSRPQLPHAGSMLRWHSASGHLFLGPWACDRAD